MTQKTILDVLNYVPNLAVQSKDDARCKALFEHLGILTGFKTSTTPNLSLIRYREHGTHWIVGMLWSGYPNPQGNGYQVFCLPKSGITEERMERFADFILDIHGGHSREDSIVVIPV